MVPSPNSRPNIQDSTTPNPSRPPAPVICAAASRKPVQSRVAAGPSFATSCGFPDAAASSMAPLSSAIPTTIAIDPTLPTVEPASLTVSAHTAGLIGASFVVDANGFEEAMLDVVGRRVQVADEAAAVDHDDAVRDAGDLIQMVAADEDRRAGVGPPEQAFAEADDARRVERVGGLVEHDHARVVLQRGRQSDALAVA